MKIFITLIVLLASVYAISQPANDVCTGAISLGTLPQPGNCGSGIQTGTAVTLNTTNVAATTENPYFAAGCITGSNDTPNSVWYSFVAPTNGYGVTINVTNGGAALANPTINLMSGACATLTGYNCATGAGGNATLTQDNQLVPGQTYYIMIGGNNGQSGTFTLSVNALQDCSDCLRSGSLTVTPQPTNGSYPPGTDVQFCYHVDQWVQIANNWLHGVQMTFGAGWDPSTLVATPPTNDYFYTGSHWDYYPTGVTEGGGTNWPAGFYFDDDNDGDPTNNFGDGTPNSGGVYSPPANEWRFCWTISTDDICLPGQSLDVDIFTSGDGESGSWTSAGCADDPVVSFSAITGCCPPTFTTTNTCTGQTTGSITSTLVGGTVSPVSYLWSPGGQTTPNLSNVGPGTYTLQITDGNNCQVTGTATITAFPLPTVNAGPDVIICAGQSTTFAATATTTETAPVSFSNNTAVAIPDNGINDNGAGWNGVGGGATSTITTSGINSGWSFGSVTFNITHSWVSDLVVYLQNPCGGLIRLVRAEGGSGDNFTNTTFSQSATANITTGTPPFTGTWIPEGGAGLWAAFTACTTGNGNWSLVVGDDVLGDAGTITSWSLSLNNPTTPSFTWSPTTAMTGSTTLTPTVTPGATTTYTLSATSANGCTATDNITVTVNPLATANAGPDQSVCAGGSVTLAGSIGGSATSGTWSASSGSFSSTTNLGATYTPSITSGTVTLTLTTDDPAGSCIPATDQIVITVNPIPTVSAGTPVSVCAGTPVTLTGSGTATTYTWNNGVTNGVAFTPASTQTYTVTGTGTGGCTNTSTVTVTVNSIPVVVANDVSVCAGGTVTVSASGATTYSWSPATYLSASTGSSVTFTAGATTSYTVTGTGAGGCTSTDPVTVTVTPNAPINAGPDVTLCAGQSTTLTATGGNTYTWNNGLGVGNGFVVTPGSTTTYSVTGTDAVGCTGTDAITVTINTVPSVNAGTDQTVCAGTSVTLTATGASTYTWDNGVTQGVPFTPAGTTTYTVTGTTAAGCISTDQVLVTVNPLPVVNAGPDQTVCANTPVTLTGSGAATYSWTGGVTNGVAFTPAGTATYTVTGTTAAGCTGTDAVTVTVNPLPIINAGTDQTICIGASVILTATGASTYSWDNGVVQSVAFSPTSTITYTATGTTAAGCIGSDQVLVTVNPLPTVNAGLDQTICNGASVTLTGSGASTYSWNLGVTNGVSFSPSSTNTYTVTGTSAAGCVNTDQVLVTVNPLPTVNAGPDQTICVGASVTLSGSGASSYSWTGGVLNGVPFSPGATANYTVTGTDANGCINTDVVTVTVNPLPVVNAGTDQTICIGASVTLIATGASTYTWDNGVTQGVAFSPTATATYTVTGTSTAGCINTDQVQVTVNPLPVVNAGTDQTICIGASVTLTGAGASTYTWNLGVTNNVAFSPSSTNTYTVTGTSAAGCINTDQVVVTVNSLPLVNAGPDQTVCAGSSVTLTGSGAASYSWTGGVANGVAFTPGATTTYTLTGTDINGCINTDAVTVNVNPIPTVNAGPDQTVCQGASVTLSGSGASTYTWSGGVTNGVAFVPALGSTTYTVTGTTAAGCINTDQVIVNVNPNPTPVINGPTEYCTGNFAALSTSTPYSAYVWSTGSTASTINATSANNPITVTVTNGFGCQGTSPVFTVTENNIITAVSSVTICQGQSATIHGIVRTVAGTYSQTFVLGTGCDSTSNVTLVVNPLPTVNAGPDQAVCTGVATTLIATGASTYSWNNGVTQGVPFTQAVGTTTYTVTGTSSQGCINTDQVNITVNPLPTVSAGPDQAICIGATATLSGSGASTFTWNNGVSNGVAFSPSITNTYTVTGTDVNGCVNTDQVVVTVNPLPTVGAGSDVAICIGQSVTLNGSGALSYTWNNGVTNGVAFSPASTNTYTVTGTNINGCINTDQVVVTVNPLPVVNAGPDQTICIGASVTLAGSGASSYTWSGGVTNNVAFSPSSTSTYTVTGTNANGCINTDQVTVTVNPLPIVGAGADQAICVGSSVILNGTGASTYTWNNGVTNNLSFTPATTNTYTVTGTDANGCINTDQVVVTVNPLPTVGAGPDVAVCIGQSVTLTGTGAVTYTWNNGVTNGVAFTPGSTNTYTVSGTNANGCVNTDQVTVTVNPLPVVNAGPDQSICIGTSTVLAGSGASSYTWTSPVVNNVSFTPGSTATYTVTGTNANGCVNTDQVVVTVNPLPVVNAGPDQSFCAGTVVTLSGSGASTYTWNNGVTNGVSFTPAVTNTYTVTGTSAQGCTSTDQVTLTVNPIPNVTAGGDQEICIGESVTLNGGGASVYTWDNGVSNGVAFFPTTTTTYTVTGTTSAGCTDTDQVTVTVNPLPVVDAGPDVTVCVGSTVTLTGAGAATYSWDNGITNGVGFTPSVGTVTYTVTGTSAAACVSTDQVNVTVNPLPVINAGPDQAVCEGTAVTLSASGAVNYTWNNSVTDGVPFTPANTQTYTVTGTSAAGCIGTDQVLVAVNPIPLVNAGNNIPLCAGQTVTLTGSGANTYTWDNGVVNGVPFVPVVGSVTYTVTGTTTAGCTDTDDVTVIVSPLPLVNFSPDTTIGCAPLTVNFTNTTVGATDCIWTMSDGSTFSGCGSVTNTFELPGCYDVTLSTTDENGCSNSVTALNLICVEANPEASFIPSTGSVTEFDPIVDFNNTSTGASDYLWDFGDMSVTSTETNPTHNYLGNDIGEYVITLIASTPFGCLDTAYAIIQIQEELVFYVPNTFTPDDDKYNPIFQPVFTSGFDPMDYTLYIFNRWGELIFESHNAEIGWDGTYGSNGEIAMCQDGVYTWKIEFKVTKNDERKMAIGHVNLLR